MIQICQPLVPRIQVAQKAFLETNAVLKQTIVSISGVTAAPTNVWKQLLLVRKAQPRFFLLLLQMLLTDHTHTHTHTQVKAFGFSSQLIVSFQLIP